jgi:two-component system cell cycle sensor histidine kinase/response regulator CckA
MTLRVLMVEDSPTDASLVARELRALGDVESRRVESADEMREALREPWDLVLSDWAMPAFSAEAALEILKEDGRDVPFIIVSGSIGEETAAKAMRAGARDFVLKDRLMRLAPAIERELKERDERLERRRGQEALEQAEAGQRRAEEQLRESQKMEAIGRLAGGIAHDFNNLLSVILSYSSLAIAELPPGDPLREDLLEIEKAGKRAAALTRQLLAFSRRQVLQPKVVDLNNVIAGMSKMLERLIGEDVELAIHAHATDAKVLVDPGQIEQVVMNLAVNARDAMPQGGKLSVETRHVEHDESFLRDHIGARPGPHVMLAVSDDGTGMDAETRARIFEPFFTTKEVGKGTGLGLSTVLGIIQQSGGTIYARSEPGVGTTFEIFLPLAEGRETAGRPVPGPSNLRGTETVLLCEDDPPLRALVRSILRQYGYEVLEAQSGGDALLLCEQHPAEIHLLLTDVVMPRMSGRQLAERLAPLRPNMRVIYMSGYTEDAVIQHGVLDADVAFLQKPITPEALARKVRETLDHPRAHRAG